MELPCLLRSGSVCVWLCGVGLGWEAATGLRFTAGIIPPQSHKHDTTSNFITTHTDVGPIHKDNRSDHQEKGIWMKGVGDSVCIHREINLGGGWGCSR